MPDVWEFMHDLYQRPTTYQLMKAQVGYSAPKDIENPEDFILKSPAGGGIKSFDSLPLHVQDMIIKNQGFNSFAEYDAWCKKHKETN